MRSDLLHVPYIIRRTDYTCTSGIDVLVFSVGIREVNRGFGGSGSTDGAFIYCSFW